MNMNTETKRPWARMIAELARRMIAAALERGDIARTENVLIHRWAGHEVEERRALSVGVAASDDELEQAAPLLAVCLKNDPPRMRRRVLAAVRATHRNIEHMSVEARP